LAAPVIRIQRISSFFILGHSSREVNFIARPRGLFLSAFGGAAGQSAPA
jgi:hypothetical protein